jgi:tellurite resistance protein TehA-like permease
MDPNVTPPFVALSTGTVFLIVFVLVFIIWLMYTGVVAYHWFRYGKNAKIGVPLFVAHILISGFLFILAVSGFLLHLSAYIHE